MITFLIGEGRVEILHFLTAYFPCNVALVTGRWFSIKNVS